jgi:hypothetical protein
MRRLYVNCRSPLTLDECRNRNKKKMVVAHLKIILYIRLGRQKICVKFRVRRAWLSLRKPKFAVTVQRMITDTRT